MSKVQTQADEMMERHAFLGVPRETFEAGGRAQFVRLLNHGLTPESRVLDIGCGFCASRIGSFVSSTRTAITESNQRANGLDTGSDTYSHRTNSSGSDACEQASHRDNTRLISARHCADGRGCSHRYLPATSQDDEYAGESSVGTQL